MSGAIVAIGGAEFSMRPENEALHDYLVGLAGKDEVRICLLPTASGDPHEQISAFRSSMTRRGCIPSAISLFRLGDEPIDLEAHLLAQDIIYVTGGSMVNLLALWRAHGIDQIMREAHRRGVLLCGYSAGSMCWFEQGVSKGSGAPAVVEGLGLMGGSHCVHYSEDPERRAAYRRAVGARTIPAGLALDDHVAALIRDGHVAEIVSSRETARGFRVEPGTGGVAEERPLATRVLPGPASVEQADELEEMRAIRRMRAGEGGRLGR